MPVLFKVLLIILIVIAVLFVVTFLVYLFNLDMKMLSKLKPFFIKHYDKRKRERKI